jgi:hypothetical protein
MSCPFGNLTPDCIPGFGVSVVELLAKYNINTSQHLYEIYVSEERWDSFLDRVSVTDKLDWIVYAPSQSEGLQAIIDDGRSKSTADSLPRYVFDPNNARIGTPVCELQWISPSVIDATEHYETENACLADNALAVVLQLSTPHMDVLSEASIFEEYARVAQLPIEVAKPKIRHLFESLRVYNSHQTYDKRLFINPWKLTAYPSVNHQLWKCALHSRFYHTCFMKASFPHFGQAAPLTTDEVHLILYGMTHRHKVELPWHDQLNDELRERLNSAIASSAPEIQLEIFGVLEARGDHWYSREVMTTNIRNKNEGMIQWLIFQAHASVNRADLVVGMCESPELMPLLMAHAAYPMTIDIVFTAIRLQNIDVLHTIFTNNTLQLSPSNQKRCMRLAFENPSKVSDLFVEKYSCDSTLLTHCRNPHGNIVRLVERGAPMSDAAQVAILRAQSPVDVLLMLTRISRDRQLYSQLLVTYEHLVHSDIEWRPVIRFLLDVPEMDVPMSLFSRVVILNDVGLCQKILPLLGKYVPLYEIIPELNDLFMSALKQNRVGMVRILLSFDFLTPEANENEAIRWVVEGQFVEMGRLLLSDARIIASTTSEERQDFSSILYS